MTNSGRFDDDRVFCFAQLLILAATSGRRQRAPILDQIAKTYGIDSWDQSRGDPLHLEWGNYRTLQSCSQVGVGAQDQQGHL